ncbi:MAG: glycoside hydrolase family 16 protein [Caulobacter sp.]|nr:glycoside hydrolase family 16 protein [Caulobacter sp.]
MAVRGLVRGLRTLAIGLAASLATDASSAEPSTRSGRLIWQDEFSADLRQVTPDFGLWRFETGNGGPALPGWGNREQQYYTGSPRNLAIRDGMLVVTAVALDPSRPDGPGPTSARLMSRPGILPRLGLFEIRARLPCGRGVWPAVWMLGEEGPWPDRGEIDIAEWAGAFFEVDELQMALHDRARHGANPRLVRFPIQGGCGQFHVYRLWRTEREVRIAVDGDADEAKLVHRSEGATDSLSWPYAQPFQLIFNVAIGGDLGGPLDSSGPETYALEVDYVRVYALEDIGEARP